MKKILKNSSNVLVLLLILSFALSACGTRRRSSQGMEGDLTESELNIDRDKRFGEGSIPLPEEGGFLRDVRFEFDSSTLGDAARQDLEYNVSVLQANPHIKVQLEGHTDERGTVEYNLTLGERRARAVYDMIVSYGIEAGRLSTISYGEELPLEPASHETAWAKNRRVHFSAYTQ